MTGSVNTMVGNNEGSLMTGVKFPNFLGRGEKLQADYTYGTKKSSNFNISLVKPLRGRMKTILNCHFPRECSAIPHFSHAANSPPGPRHVFHMGF